MREFLSANSVPFEDRNIRRSDQARLDLDARTGNLVVPQLFWRDTHIVGFDEPALVRLAEEYGRPIGAVTPPGNSLEAAQAGKVADAGETLTDGLLALLDRIRAELDFNTAKGAGQYRLGVHDALRFADDAVVELLRSHGQDVQELPRAADA